MKWWTWALLGVAGVLYLMASVPLFLYALSSHNSICRSILFWLRWPYELALSLFMRR